MRRLADSLYLVSIVLWVGGLWAIGTIAAPTLFAMLGDRGLAGALAGRMFFWAAWAGIVCGAYLLFFLVLRHGLLALKRSVFWMVLAMFLLTLAGHFGIQPVLAQLKADAWPREAMESVVRQRFSAWHGIASALYLIQSLLGLALVVNQRKGM